MRQNGAAVHVHLVTNGDIVTEHGNVFQACPSADGAVPAYNGGLDPCMVLDLGVLQQNASLQSDAITDHDARANCYIGSDAAVLANLGGRVNHDIASVHVRLGCRSQQLGVLP